MGTYTVEHADYTEATIAKNSDGMIVVSKTKAAGEISSPSSEAMDEGVFITRDGDDIILHWKPWEVTGIFSRRGTDNTGKFTITWGKKIFTKIQASEARGPLTPPYLLYTTAHRPLVCQREREL